MLTGETPLSPAWHALIAGLRSEAGKPPVVGGKEIPDSLLEVLTTYLEEDIEDHSQYLQGLHEL